MCRFVVARRKPLAPACAVVVGVLVALAGCQSPSAEPQRLWRYYPEHDTFHAPALDIWLYWDGERWVEYRTPPAHIAPEDEPVDLARVAPTPYAQWTPHPRSYRIPFDYEPYPYLRFRYEEPTGARPPYMPRPYYYDEQPYPYEE